MPISKPLKTIGVGHRAAIRAAGDVFHDIVFEVVAVALDRLKSPCHQREQFDFALDQFATRSVVKVVRRRIEQPGQIGRETDLGDHDRVIRLCRHVARSRAVASCGGRLTSTSWRIAEAAVSCRSTRDEVFALLATPPLPTTPIGISPRP